MLKNYSDKGCYASLCKSFVFDWSFRKFHPEQKCLGLYVVTLRILYEWDSEAGVDI